MPKFYVEHRSFLVVDSLTRGEALANLIERKVADGQTQFEDSYFIHEGDAKEGDHVLLVECYWHVQPTTRKILSACIRSDYPEQYTNWCEAVVANAPSYDEY